MSGILTTLPNLTNAASKFLSATNAENERRKAMVEEFKNDYLRQGKGEWLAGKLAEEKYLLIHKNNLK